MSFFLIALILLFPLGAGASYRYRSAYAGRRRFVGGSYRGYH
jgi:hypothetical protein